jgi:transcriptional regulator GlxA family with amidase domain
MARRKGFPSSSTEGSRTALEKAVGVMRRDYRRPLTLDELAAVVRLSPSRFSHLFRGIFGCSPMWLLKHLRLAGARRLVETTSLSGKQVLHATGFSDWSHFCRSFRATYGCTPRELRQAIREQAYVEHSSEASRLGGVVATKKCQLGQNSSSVTTVELPLDGWGAMVTSRL